MTTGSPYLTITGYTGPDFQTPLSGKPYTAIIDSEPVSNASNSDAMPGYDATTGTLNFALVIDCTVGADKATPVMPEDIDALQQIILACSDDITRPNFVRLQWSNGTTFYCVLSYFDIEYGSQDAAGDPQTASIPMVFHKYTAPESPDINKEVDTEEGATLPQLTQQVWNDESYYIQTAKFNGLNKFRNLSGIQKLVFPPIVQPA